MAQKSSIAKLMLTFHLSGWKMLKQLALGGTAKKKNMGGLPLLVS